MTKPINLLSREELTDATGMVFSLLLLKERGIVDIHKIVHL